MFLLRRHQEAPAITTTRTMRISEMTLTDYLLPVNYAEIDRLDFQHLMLKIITKGNYFAPISQPGTILDVGCGTGRWCLELAHQFPAARIRGIDITPPLGLTDVPDNCTFVFGNILTGLTDIPAQSQAFTHARLLIAALAHDAWPRVVAEYARVTKPGGWVELVEGSFPAGTPAMDQISQWSHEAGMQRNIDMRVGPQLVTLLQYPLDVVGESRPVRFTKLHQREIPLPIGEYGGRAGRLMQVDVIAAVAAIRQRVLDAGVCSAAAYDAQAQRLPVEFAAYKTGTVTFWVTFAQRV